MRRQTYCCISICSIDIHNKREFWIIVLDCRWVLYYAISEDWAIQVTINIYDHCCIGLVVWKGGVIGCDQELKTKENMWMLRENNCQEVKDYCPRFFSENLKSKTKMISLSTYQLQIHLPVIATKPEELKMLKHFFTIQTMSTTSTYRTHTGFHSFCSLLVLKIT